MKGNETAHFKGRYSSTDGPLFGGSSAQWGGPVLPFEDPRETKGVAEGVSPLEKRLLLARDRLLVAARIGSSTEVVYPVT